MAYTRYPSAGGLVEPLTLTQVLTLAAAGVSFGTAGTLTNGGTNTILASSQIQAGAAFQVGAATARFSGQTTQTLTSAAAMTLFGFCSNQTGAQACVLGTGSNWAAPSVGAKLIRFEHSINNNGIGTSVLDIMGTGKFDYPAAGTQDVVGTATLSGGTKVVTTTAVEAGDLIFVSCNTPAGTTGKLSAPVASIVAATSFVINSDNAADTSTVNWWIVKKG